MSVDRIMNAIHEEIRRLLEARKLITMVWATTSLHSAMNNPGPKKQKRTLSAETRRKIAVGQRRRWAERKAKK
jgi:hypothetical protein